MNKSTATANEPLPTSAVALSNLITVNKFLLDEIAADIDSAIELVDAADSLAVALCAMPDESNPVHAVLYRAINELRDNVNALFALL